MTHTARATALTAAAVAATLLATGGTAAADARTAHHRATVVVHTTSKHKVAGPAKTRPGMARFHNTGSHAIILVTPRHGASKATLARDLNADTAGRIIKDFTVADALSAKTTTYLHLSRGTYYLADLDRDHFTKATVATLRVTGSTVNAKTPKARQVVVTTHDTISSPASIAAGSELRFRNESAHLQELFLWPVATKVTTAQLNAFVAKPSFAKLYDVVSGEPAYLALLSSKMRATSSEHSATGRYLLLTFTFTQHTNEPKLKAGDVRVTTVK